ncbi:MAG: hypothetical protein HY060_04640 [Proteobacteria bacterium]|nr:hypothetical protein [Pseudomonadota bacterium]
MRVKRGTLAAAGAAILLVAACRWIATAAALEFSVVGSPPEAIVATGDIVRDDVAKFQRLTASLPRRPGTVYLSSGGGSLGEGMALGSFFRSEGFATRVGRNQSCASACVFAFLGGIIREVDPAGRVGVHMASLMLVEEYVQNLKNLLLDNEIPLDTKIRLIIALNEQAAARAASAEASYLVRMGVSLRILKPITDNLQTQIHWLTRQELVDYNVVNVK